jgi:hypothetical protein
MLVSALTIADKSCFEANEPFTIKIGTICSGSEIIYTVIPHLEAAFKSHMQINLQFKHVFACEADLGKARWIAENTDVPFIFLDVNDLSAPEGAMNFRTNKKAITLDWRAWLPALHANMHLD